MLILTGLLNNIENTQLILIQLISKLVIYFPNTILLCVDFSKNKALIKLCYKLKLKVHLPHMNFLVLYTILNDNLPVNILVFINSLSFISQFH